jgi:hypothetical protein
MNATPDIPLADTIRPADMRFRCPVWDRGDQSLFTVHDLMAEAEKLVASGSEIPYLAFVSGPGMNLLIQFSQYDPASDKSLVRAALATFILQGANHILVLGDVWIRDNNGVPTWDGMMIGELTPTADRFYLAEFEGRNRLGDWLPYSSGDGNLCGLFALARGLADANR